MARFELIDAKIHDDLSEETLACSAKLTLDGEIVGHVRNSGTGGGTYVRWNSREARELWMSLLAKHPETLKRVERGHSYPQAWAEEHILDTAIQAGGGLVMEGEPKPFHVCDDDCRSNGCSERYKDDREPL